MISVIVLVRMTRFWINIHHVRSKAKDWKTKLFLKSLEVMKPKDLDRI